jgi:hypothetical protein
MRAQEGRAAPSRPPPERLTAAPMWAPPVPALGTDAAEALSLDQVPVRAYGPGLPPACRRGRHDRRGACAPSRRAMRRPTSPALGTAAARALNLDQVPARPHKGGLMPALGTDAAEALSLDQVPVRAHRSRRASRLQARTARSESQPFPPRGAESGTTALARHPGVPGAARDPAAQERAGASRFTCARAQC